jgi:hypothetical protein
LLGGGRLHNLIARFSKLNSIKNFVEAKNWTYGVGYEVGPPDKQIRSASYITNHPSLPTTALSENYTDETQIFTETAEKFHRVSNATLFMPPHLLIKTNAGGNEIPTYFTDKYLTFKKVITGISAPENERNQLLELSTTLSKNGAVYKLVIAATSNKYLVSRMATLTQDIMNLPYPEDKEELSLSFAEQIICEDALKYYSEIKAESSNAKFNKDAEKNDLENYGAIFSKALNSIYQQPDKCFSLKKIYDWNEYFITEFSYGEPIEEPEFEEVDEPTESIKSLIETQLGRNFYLIRVVRINEKNKFSFIKPKALRYWLRSIALKDADETFSDLIKAEY